MALVTFNNKLVGSSNGMLTFDEAPDQSPVTQSTYSPNKAGITTSKTTLMAGKKGVTLTAKSDDTVWEEQEEPSLGSGGY